MDIIKVTTKNNGVYLIKEVFNEFQKDVYYGYLINLSQEIIITQKTGTKTGNFNYFNEKPIRIVSKKDVTKIEEPTELDLNFVDLLKDKGTINYSNKLISDYNLEDVVKIKNS